MYFFYIVHELLMRWRRLEKCMSTVGKFMTYAWLSVTGNQTYDIYNACQTCRRLGYAVWACDISKLNLINKSSWFLAQYREIKGINSRATQQCNMSRYFYAVYYPE